MCPSYLASKDEKDVTRGRARVLQELTNGTMIPDFTSEEVHESLDLCLSCKACASDCPAGVDMAQYKSEVLHRTYRGEATADQPLQHRLAAPLDPVIDKFPTVGPAVINRTLAVKPLSRLMLSAGGIDPRRSAPMFAATHLPPVVPEEQDRTARRTPVQAPVVLWTDSFTNGMNPEVARAAITCSRRRVPGHHPRRGGLLRPDLDHYRPARRRQEAPRPAAGYPRTLCGAGHSDCRTGTLLYRGAAVGPGRPATDRSTIQRGRRCGQDPGRAADRHRRPSRHLAGT